MITPSFGLTATERVLPKLALDFTTASLDSRVTFTRTTGASNPATYVDNSGYVTAATNNQARFDYDPVTLACKGLLIEESRANLLLHSQDFSTTWVVSAASVSTDVVVSPDGTQNADKLIESATTATHFINQTVTTTNATVYTASVYAKAGERSAFRISRAGGSVGSGFDLSTQQVVNASGASGTITSAGNGWYRCTMTFTTASTSTGVYFELQTSASGSSQSYAGNGTNGLYLYGAQFELGAFATSYIPTTSAALTRNADVATMTGTNFSDWFNASEGTLCVQGYRDTATGVAGLSALRLASIDDTTATNSMFFTPTSSTAPRFRVRVSGSDTALISSTVSGNTVSLCGAYKINNVDFASNANLGTPDTSAAIPTVTQLQFGYDPLNAIYMSGYIQKVQYYPQHLTTAELQSFSKV